MTRQALRVAAYRFRATFARQWAGYLATVLLIGLLGGLAMGAVAGARRTQSSFPTLLERVNSSDLLVLTGVYNPGIGLNNGYNPATLRAISHLRFVKDVRSLVELNLVPLQSDGAPILAAQGTSMNGSVDGEEFDQDRVIVTDGRLPDPRRADEFAMDSATAKVFGLHLGQWVTFDAFTNAQAADFSSIARVIKTRPFLRVRIRLVGVGIVQASDLMQDDVDAGGSDVLFTPALTARLLRECVNTALSGLQLQGGTIHEAAVEAELTRVLPKGLPTAETQLSNAVAKAERTLLPESIALGVFGAIAALALVVIAGQAIGRRLRSDLEARAILRALGAEPATTVLDGLVGVVGAVVAGSALAVLVAVCLSPLAPLGPVRPYLPEGLNFDWTVLASGFAVLVILLSAAAITIAVRLSPHHLSSRRARTGGPASLARAAEAAGLPLPVVTGVRFALESSAGRDRVPVRSAVLGTVLAVIVVVSTVTFGASLRALVTHPALYGWAWTYELNGGGGLGDIPAVPAARLLDNDRYVAAWAGVYFSTLQIDGQPVPVMGASPNAAVGPPILTGHGLDGPGEVVLGPATLAELHEQVGDTVEVSSGTGAPTRLRIVGTATLPAIGIGGTTHLEMGNGAVLDYEIIPPAARNLYDVSPGPNAILVRDKPGANARDALISLEAMVSRLDMQSNGGAVVGVQRPAEIINYGSLGATPTLLGVALAAGAVTALGLTLVASVRRRRRDLALLKTLGFTRSQLAAAVAWQSTAAVAIGALFGVPLGIVLGRLLWDLFAQAINAVPAPTVPVTWMVLIAVAALVLGNLVAAVPGRVAARTPTAVLLRAE